MGKCKLQLVVAKNESRLIKRNSMTFWGEVNDLLGLHRQAQDLRFSQIALRAIIMFFAVLTMLRVSDKRFLAQRNPLDTLLSILLASMLARSINGSERF